MSQELDQPRVCGSCASAAGAAGQRPSPPNGWVAVHDVTLSVVAVVLLVAASLKYELPSSLNGTFESAAARQQALLTFLLPSTEAALGFALLAGFAGTWLRRAAMGLLCLFSVVSAYLVISGVTHCGCFGNVRIHPGLTLGFDLVALALLYWARLKSGVVCGLQGRLTGTGRLRVIRIMGAGTLAATTIVLSRHWVYPEHGGPGSGGRYEVITSSGWEGKPFPLISQMDEDAQARVATGSKTLVIFDHGCASCRRYIAGLLVPGTARNTADIILLDIAENRMPESDFLRGIRVERFRTRTNYIADVPIEVKIRDGVVYATSHPAAD